MLLQLFWARSTKCPFISLHQSNEMAQFIFNILFLVKLRQPIHICASAHQYVWLPVHPWMGAFHKVERCKNNAKYIERTGLRLGAFPDWLEKNIWWWVLGSFLQISCTVTSRWAAALPGTMPGSRRPSCRSQTEVDKLTKMYRHKTERDRNSWRKKHTYCQHELSYRGRLDSVSEGTKGQNIWKTHLTII